VKFIAPTIVQNYRLSKFRVSSLAVINKPCTAAWPLCLVDNVGFTVIYVMEQMDRNGF
jgi:hypothetical protein